MTLEYEPIELLYLVLVIVALGFALFFFIISLAICCTYARNGFGVPNTEDEVATNEPNMGPQILSVVSMHPYFDPDNQDGQPFSQMPGYHRYKFEEPPPNYDSIFDHYDLYTKSKLHHQMNKY